MSILNDNSSKSPRNLYAAEVEITPRVFYVAEHSQPDQHKFAFGYEIHIINRGSHTVQLIDRHWQIDQGNGCIQDVRGAGVIGEQPTLPPGKSHRYQSGAIIETPAGRMWGDYGFINEHGTEFRVEIPLFHLVAPSHFRPVH